ncbi:MAG: FAD-dependent oxidoreductase, partial [Candidatus Bathyarchaeia archaeon]
PPSKVSNRHLTHFVYSTVDMLRISSSSHKMLKIVSRARKTDKRKLKFNKLILATGGRPFKPNIPGINKKGVFQIRSIEDALKIREFAKSGGKAIVIGAGFIGLMMGEALFNRGMKVTVVEKLPQVLPALFEPELSKVIQNNLEKKGIEFMLNATADEIYGGKKVSKVKVLESKLESSLVICATGVIPNLYLAEQIGLKLGRKAILVNGYCRTSIPDVYAAGDCTETLEYISKKISYIPVGSIAAMEGKISGANAAGKLIKHKGMIRSQNERIFNLDLVSMGLTFNEAKSLGIKPSTLDITGKIFTDRKEGFEKAMSILNSNNSIVGLQIITRSYAHRYSIDFLKAIENRINIEELLDKRYPFKTLLEIKHGS